MSNAHVSDLSHKNYFGFVTLALRKSAVILDATITLIYALQELI